VSVPEGVEGGEWVVRVRVRRGSRRSRRKAVVVRPRPTNRRRSSKSTAGRPSVRVPNVAGELRPETSPAAAGTGAVCVVIYLVLDPFLR